MPALEIIIFEPNTSEESEALKAFGKALKLKFKITETGGFEDNQEIEIPEAHKAIIAERLEDYKKNPNNNLNFDELLKGIRIKYNL